MNLRALRLLITFAVAAFISAGAADSQLKRSPLQDRTTTAKTCADLLAQIGRRAQEADRAKTLNVVADIPEGTVYLSPSGTAAVRLYGPSGQQELLLADASEVDVSIKRLAEQAKSRKREIIFTGSIGLDKLYESARQTLPADVLEYVFFSVDPQGNYAQAKRRLLDQAFLAVEIVVDIPLTSGAVEQSLRTIPYDRDQPSSSEKVRFLSAQDLPGPGNLAERLRHSRPGPGVLRITVFHQRSGFAILTDGSTISLKELGEHRVLSGAFDVHIACHRPYDDASWIIFDEKVFGDEIAALAQRIRTAFSSSEKMTGREILSQCQLFDDGDSPPNGGDNPPPSSPSTGDNPRRPKARRSLKVLSLMPFALVSQVSTNSYSTNRQHSGTGTDAGIEPIQPSTKQGGTLFLSLMSRPGDIKVGGSQRWFRTAAEAIQIRDTIGSRLYDQPTVFLDTLSSRLLFFQPDGLVRYAIPAPILTAGLDSDSSSIDRAQLEEISRLFWLARANKENSLTTRTRLLDWQNKTGVTFPFLFVAEGLEATPALWELVKPFFKDITVVGECLPRSAQEAWASGMFWCKAHDTEGRMRLYRSLVDEFAEHTGVTRVDLRGDPATALSEAFERGTANAWLIGAWTPSGLRRPGGVLSHSQWVRDQSCQGRVTFLSAYPVGFPPEGRYFETAAHMIFANGLKKLHVLAESDADFPKVQETLATLLVQLDACGGYLAISSCAKYMILSE